MVRAGALLYALLLVLIISVITGTAMLSTYYQHIYVDSSIERQRAITNINSAINLYLEVPEVVQLGQTKTIHLFDQQNDQVTLNLMPWGLFSVLTVESGWRNLTHSRKALIGDDVLRLDPVALYLTDQNNYLSVCGQTKIKGKVSLPKLGVKRAYIEGESFSGTKMIDGKVEISKRNLPALNEPLFSRLATFLRPYLADQDSVRMYEEYLDQDTILNSFDNAVLVLDCADRKLKNKVIIGNVIVKCKYPVEIENSFYLEDGILIAGGIQFNKGAKNKGQFYAIDSISTEEECEFLYPSCLGVFQEKKKETMSFLRLGEETKVYGCVFLIQKERDFKKHAQIEIGKDAEIYGQVYSNDYLQHNGKVYGSIYCNKFVLKTASSIYENHLLDAEINLEKLPDAYVGVSLFEETSKKQIIKWLN